MNTRSLACPYCQQVTLEIEERWERNGDNYYVIACSHCHATWGAYGDPNAGPDLHLLSTDALYALTSVGLPPPRFSYTFAEDDECGLLYRPGEMSIEALNYCKLARGHRGRRHSTKEHRHDVAGFDWDEPEDDGMRWPVR